MIQIPAQAKVFVIPKPISANEPLDDVIAACKECGFNSFSGQIFVFRDEIPIKLGYYHMMVMVFNGV